MWKFKDCPKCKGDTYLEHDFDGGWYEHCLQCGYRRYMPTILELESHESKEKKQPVKGGRRS